jgi:transposase
LKVSLSFVQRLIRRYQETGEIKPKPRSGGARAIIKKSELGQIEQMIDEQPDAFLRELCGRWEQQKGVKVSVSTMCRRLRNLQLTTKKNSICE